MPESMNPEVYTKKLSDGRHRCLLLGACGTGMKSLAPILSEAGHEIFGADAALVHRGSGTSALVVANGETPGGNESGLRLPVTWIAEHSIRSHGAFDIAVRSPAVPAASDVVRQLTQQGTRCLTLQEALDEVFHNRQQICVAGTHGKSTTTALVSWILGRADRALGYFIGAEPAGMQAGGSLGSGPMAVIESCEFSRSFCHLNPTHILLTNIDRDHFDCFPDECLEDDAFQQFLRRSVPDGILLVSAACERSHRAVAAASRFAMTFGVSTNGMVSAGDWTADRVSLSADGIRFCVRRRGVDFATIHSRLFGYHNVRNVLAAVAMCAELGVSAAQCRTAVEEFPGLRRRFEIRGQYGGMALVDDYAHHPREVAATLQAARTAFPGRRIVAVLEPHQVSRTKALFSDFAGTLTTADEALLLPVFAARENPSGAMCRRLSGQLVRAVNQRGGRAFLLANLDQVISRIDDSGRPGDVILTMGAGRTNLIHDEFTRRLQRHSAA
ncbi:MAG: cyanophycin synthetase [Planctomycetaceae bacterium]